MKMGSICAARRIDAVESDEGAGQAAEACWS